MKTKADFTVLDYADQLRWIDKAEVIAKSGVYHEAIDSIEELAIKLFIARDVSRREYLRKQEELND